MKKTKDGIDLYGLGECTLDDVFNDPNGIDGGKVYVDEEYYYVFPNYKHGYSGDAFWIVNRETKDVASNHFHNLLVLNNDFDLEKLTQITIDEFRRAVS